MIGSFAGVIIGFKQTGCALLVALLQLGVYKVLKYIIKQRNVHCHLMQTMHLYMFNSVPVRIIDACCLLAFVDLALYDTSECYYTLYCMHAGDNVCSA
jgi:hypothetical protein